MNIKALDHISIAVHDVAEAAAFFEKSFGLKVAHTEDIPEQGVKVAFIELGGVSIELIQPLDESSSLHKYLSKRGPGMHHIALNVDDIESCLANMKATGSRLIDEIPRKGAHGKKIAFVYPNKSTGVLIELCETIDD